MAMLAEPRQRKRYNLVPRGKPLFDDNDRFGTKMLEKMGWSKGKGLGSREDGEQDFIRVKYKKDVIGLGFQDRDDQWTEHEKQFNGLLENLNSDDSTKNSLPDDCEIVQPTVGLGFVSKSSTKKKLKDKFSGQSLEEKSKNSKARVHYKKFTKGKDMSQYSEKDLANIFGKKASPEDENIYNQFQAFTAVDTNEEKETPLIKQPPKDSSTQIINTGVSVSDYFKLKMEALKQKKSGVVLETTEDKSVEIDISSTNKRKSEEPPDSSLTPEEVPRKKKKSKKNLIEVKEDAAVAETSASEEKPNRKNKKNKKCLEEKIGIDIAVEECTEKPQSKKKKRKTLENTEEENTIENGNVDSSEFQSHFDGSENSENIEERMVVEVSSEEHQPKKKKKKTVESIEEENQYEDSSEFQSPKLENEIVVAESIEENLLKKKKKKSTKKTNEVKVTENSNEDSFKLQLVPAETEAPKKKKKNKRQTTDIDELQSFSENENKKKPTKTFVEEGTKITTPLETDQEKAPEYDKTVSATTTIGDCKQKKSKKKNKSSDPSPNEVSSHQQDLNSCMDNSLIDTYTISTFCAEKFRLVELHRFKDSSIAHINGYGLSDNLELIISKNKNDEERIIRLWSGTLDKYTHATPKQKIYSIYRNKAYEARKLKSKKIPKLKVKSLKRTQVFQGL